MPKPRKKEQIVCTFYAWLLGQRGGIFAADGRSNSPSLGRHSLGTRDRNEALRALQRLDQVMAVRFGRASSSVLHENQQDLLDLEEGWKQYERYIGRPQVMGGARPATAKRYGAIRDKFLPFVRRQGITVWNQVTRSTIVAYASFLDEEEYAYGTQYLELTMVKSIMKWFVENGLLPATCRISQPLRKPDESSTYCWSAAEVAAIVDMCNENKELGWLGDAVTGLACSGLRISELAGLRWADVDLVTKVISLIDESTLAASKVRRPARVMKSRRSRSFPIHPQLETLLKRIPRAADAFVFHGAQGHRLEPDDVRRILVRDVLTPLAKKFPTPPGEIGFQDGRLHSFRHYFCSVCANEGIPEQVLMTWLGHANSRMIKRYYHLHNAEAQRQMRRVKFISKAGRKRSAD